MTPTTASTARPGIAQPPAPLDRDLCPADVYEHLGVGTVDPVAYALAVDALTHPGPADPARISPATCAQPYMPGVNPANVNTELQLLAGAPGLLSVTSPVSLVGVPTVRSEPPLDCYVYASAPAGCAT